ncbi:MAG: amino acid adenylation domain-containing protein [Bacteroidetes bacterium]|jgi:D-alanine--poly(phosphoribitol) ligase subunit 1|nr:amino acid adenylation domain-containing protein [Bacteroidota bacterium]MBT6686696.1 amino acid adenylation domain-containing protein [Bacteroidota bacterium]MBT7141834.1 amino acid adenylation domain-containing protein [Bacteroidota bacterium]MBT7490675.1 amino acid adenylation domain-containing protein [Bacteroidota bacterium]
MKSENSVVHRFRVSLEQFPDRTAIFINNESYTYLELSLIVSSIKDKILLEAKPNKLIGLVTGDDNIYTYASILAILSSGAGYVPINLKNPTNRNLNILNQAEISTVLISSSNVKIEKELHEFKIIQTSELEKSNIEFSVEPIDDEQIAYLLFTSGSTGTPKGVPIYHKNLNSFVDNYTKNEIYNFNENDRFLQMYELTFDPSVQNIFVCLSIGALLFVVSKKGVLNHNIVKTLEKHKITWAAVVPSFLNYLRPYFSEIYLPELKYFHSGGEALHADLIKEWSISIPNAIIENVYGPTETTVFCLSYRWNNKSEKEAYNGVLPIGKVVQNMEAVIVNENNEILKRGEKGELCVGGNQITQQYWKNEKKTKESFIKIKNTEKKTFYKTGDLCFENENGNLVFLGRIDNQVKIDGFRVELEEIEYFAKEYLQIANISAIAAKNRKGNLSVVLFVENLKEDKTKIINFLKQKLPIYMIPSDIQNISKMPYNINGKIDKLSLKDVADQTINSTF